MFKLLDFPVVFSLLSRLVMWLAARLAASVPNRESTPISKGRPIYFSPYLGAFTTTYVCELPENCG